MLRHKIHLIINKINKIINPTGPIVVTTQEKPQKDEQSSFKRLKCCPKRNVLNHFQTISLKEITFFSLGTYYKLYMNKYSLLCLKIDHFN